MAEKTPGGRFGPYEIVAPLGSGGMGEVYRATDTRLQRDVALKILTAVDQEDSRRQRRFLQEARAASALNHPNILSVFDIGSENGTQYIVSELVDGESLRTLIDKGPMPLRRFLDIAIQVASGLTVAHEAGIVHRDLKPENIMVGRDNRVKVLDFGLAKVLMPVTGTADEQTRSDLLTMPGVILGTVAYMSPEQAKASNVDFRSDQFSFGLILYEMATGRKAFSKDTPVQTLSAIIAEDPPSISTLNDKFPAPIRWMIERCLAKDPRERYGATIDLYHELRDFREHLSETSFSGEAAPASIARKAKSWVTLGTAIVASVLLGFLIAALIAPRDPILGHAYRFTPLAVNPEFESFASWSPDGKSVAYIVEMNGVQQLFVRSLASPTPQQLTRVKQDVLAPFWSADGSRIYYTTEEHDDFHMWAIGIAGGSPELVLANAVGGAASRDGKWIVVFRPDEESPGAIGMWLISPPGSDPKKYDKGSFRAGRHNYMYASFSPDSSQLLVYSKSYDEDSHFDLISLPDGEPRSMKFLAGLVSFGASWLPDNKRFVVSSMKHEADHHLWLVDPERETLQPILTSVTQEWAPSVSPDGSRILFSSAIQQYDLIEVPLDGSPIRNLTDTPVNEKAPAWSRHGSQFAFVSNITGWDVIWMRSTTEGWQRPLVMEKDFADRQTISFSRPFFSPDGQGVTYHRNSKSGAEVWISSVAGGTPVRLHATGEYFQLAPSWSPDGNWIAFIQAREKQSGMTLARARVGGSDPPVVLKEEIEYLQPQWSPDGAWILYQAGGGVHLISTDGKNSRQVSKERWLTGGWSLDGKTLHSIRQSENRRLLVMATNVETGEERLIVDAGVSPILFTDAVFAGFSAAPDGKSFATSVLKTTSDIWILEDFNPQPRPLFWFLKEGEYDGKKKTAQ